MRWTVTVNTWGFNILLKGTSVLKTRPSTSPASSPLFNSNPTSSNPVPYRLSSLLPFHASCFFFFSPQVANLACSISNNEEGVKLVRMAATQIDSLCPQVSKTQSLRQNFAQTPQVNAFGCFLFTLIAVWRVGTKLIDDRLIGVASWTEGRDGRVVN